MVTLVVSLFLLEWSSAVFGEHIVDSLDIIQKCLACKLRLMLDDDTPYIEVSNAENLDSGLLRKSVGLDSVYEQAAFEIRLGRLDGTVASYDDFIDCNSSLIHFSHFAQAFHQDYRTPAPRACMGNVNTQGFPVSYSP